MPAPPRVDPYSHPDFIQFEKRRGLGVRSYARDEAKAILACGDTRLSTLMKTGELPAARVGRRKISFGARDLAMVLWKSLNKPHDLPDNVPPVPPSKTEQPKERGRPRGVVRQIKQV